MIIEKVLVPFNVEQVNDKDLVIRMLKYEEEYNRENNIAIYQGEMYSHLPDIEKIKRINRATLLHFGFDTSDESVKNYKRIFRTYFRSAEDYDEEVINSSYYMRYNRCVFYVEPIINVGDQIPDCKLLTVDNQEEVSLHNIIKEYDGVYTLVAAFSMTGPPFLARINHFISMAEDLRKNNIKIILVQTWEAHTKAEWTIGHPKETENQQQSLAERVERAKTFLAQYGKVYPVYVDKWDNEFETKFRAWPDKYYCVDRNMKVIAKSVYNKGGSLDAMIKKDYTILLRELMNK